MNRNVIPLTLIVLSLLATGTAIGLLIAEQFLINSGTIVIQNLSIKAYSDSSCTTPISTLSWGTLNQGSHKEITLYLKNTGNIPATLSCIFSTWSPSTAPTYITPSWNREGSTINADSVLSVTFTLDVSENIVDISAFSYKATITATG